MQIRQVLGPIACHCFTRRMARRGLCGGGESLRSVVKSQRPPSSRLFFYGVDINGHKEPGRGVLMRLFPDRGLNHWRDFSTGVPPFPTRLFTI